MPQKFTIQYRRNRYSGGDELICSLAGETAQYLDITRGRQYMGGRPQRVFRIPNRLAPILRQRPACYMVLADKLLRGKVKLKNAR